MDRTTRKDLKTDHFVQEVSHGVEYVAGHKTQVARYAIAGAVVLAIAIGVYAYLQVQKSTRQEMLSKAYLIQQSPFGPPQAEAKPPYATLAERDQAATKAFAEVAAKYGSSYEGQIAKYFMGTAAASEARWSEAERLLKEVSGGGNAEAAGLAKYALAQVYAAQSKIADAEKLLRELIEKPSSLVSKEQASIALGRLLMPARPADAKKVLEPLRSERSAVSRAAMNALSGVQ